MESRQFSFHWWALVILLVVFLFKGIDVRIHSNHEITLKTEVFSPVEIRLKP